MFTSADADTSSYSNIYTRRVLAGEFQVVCPWLLRELVELKLWDDDMKNKIIAHNGSIQAIPEIPDDVKAIYKTVWEISQKKVLDLAADRGAFICQSQSLNVHLQSPTVNQLTSMHFYGWKKGLKTGMYYLRTRPAAQAIQFTLDHKLVEQTKKAQDKAKLDKATKKDELAEKKASELRATEEAKVQKADVKVDVPAATTVKSKTGIVTPPPERDASPEPSPAPAPATTAPASDSKVTEPTASAVDLTGLEGLDEKTREAAAKDPEFAAALRKLQERKYEEEKLMCSLENKEACLMCSA